MRSCGEFHIGPLIIFLKLGLRLNPTAAENHICSHRNSNIVCETGGFVVCCYRSYPKSVLVRSSINEANLLEARPTPEEQDALGDIKNVQMTLFLEKSSPLGIVKTLPNVGIKDLSMQLQRDCNTSMSHLQIELVNNH